MSLERGTTLGETIIFLTGGNAADRKLVMEKHLKPTGLFEVPQFAVSVQPRLELINSNLRDLSRYTGDYLSDDINCHSNDYFKNEEFLTKIKVSGQDLLSMMTVNKVHQYRHTILPQGEYTKGLAYSEFQFHFPHFDKFRPPFYGHIIYDAEQPEIEIPQMILGLAKQLLKYRYLEVNVLGANIIPFQKRNLLTIQPTSMDKRTHTITLPRNCIVNPVTEISLPEPESSKKSAISKRSLQEHQWRRVALGLKAKQM